MEAIKELEDILVRTAAKEMSGENRKKAVNALTALMSESNDVQKVIEYLFKLHYSVCRSFLEEYCVSASDEEITALAETLVKNEQFKNGNIRHPKGFSAVIAFAGKEKYQSAFFVLLKILSYQNGPNGSTESCINSFQKYIVDKGKLPLIMSLFDQMMGNNITCTESEQQCLKRFLKTVQETQTASTKKAKAPADESLQKNKKDAISDIEKMQQDILKHILSLVENRTSIDKLTAALAQRDEDLNLSRNLVMEKERRIISLSDELTVNKKQLLQKQEQIEDLTNRLRTSLHMDNISKNQELITLKTDISETLKLDYADFTKSKERAYSEDLFEAYRSTLNRMFKVLKRFGIDCQ